MESITLKRTHKGAWMKRFDNYEEKFTRVSLKEAQESIENARHRGDLFCDAPMPGKNPIDFNEQEQVCYGYWN